MYELKSVKNTRLMLIDGDRGRNYPQLSDFSPDGDCLFLNAKNVTKTGFDFQNKMFITKEKDNLLRNGKLQMYDIVLTTRGTVGNVGFYDETVSYKHIRINSGMLIIRADKEEFDAEFLYFLLQSPFVQNQINQIKTGSAQPQLPVKLLNEIELIVPPINIQKAIAKKIRSLVSKINKNIQHVQILEQIIYCIYEKWFGKQISASEANLSKKGWAQSNVFENICEVKLKNLCNENHPVLSVVKEGNFKPSEDVFTKQVYSKSTTNYKIVKKNQVAYNPARANIGSIAMLKEHDVGLVSPIYVVFEMKDKITPTYFYYYMKQPMFLEGIKHHAIGTTRQNFPFEAFKMFPMVVPPMELQLEFEKIAKPIEEKIAKLKEENEVLAEIRDTLLPKLLNEKLTLDKGV